LASGGAADQRKGGRLPRLSVKGGLGKGAFSGGRKGEEAKAYTRDGISMVTVLPVFRGYTVDVRLRQFRKVKPGQIIEFVDFDSPKGRKLLEALYLTKRSII
jgi:hypothetical protein